MEVQLLPGSWSAEIHQPGAHGGIQRPQKRRPLSASFSTWEQSQDSEVEISEESLSYTPVWAWRSRDCSSG